ncbi:MAG: DUF4436 family protein [Acetobacteraceae bacterium]|nr:DUF4436 family protein [Acetobacteraceae bacterium]
MPHLRPGRPWRRNRNELWSGGEYLEPLWINPVSDSIEIRLSVAPNRSLRGVLPDAPMRDVTVIATATDWSETRIFRAGQPMAPTVIRADLSGGDIAEFPFDRYNVAIGLQSFESDGAAPAPGRPIAQEVTLWGRMLGYQFKAYQAPRSAEDSSNLGLEIRRAGAHIFFGVAAYGAIIVLACNSLVISCLVFSRQTKG